MKERWLFLSSGLAPKRDSFSVCFPVLVCFPLSWHLLSFFFFYHEVVEVIYDIFSICPVQSKKNCEAVDYCLPLSFVLLLFVVFPLFFLNRYDGVYKPMKTAFIQVKFNSDLERRW